VAEVLGDEQVGVEANLLEMGADSVSVIRIANRVEQETGWRPGLEALYRTPTVAALAEAYEEFQRSNTGIGEGQLAQTPSTVIADPEARDRFKREERGIRRFAPEVAPVVLPAALSEEELRNRFLHRRSHRRFLAEPVQFAALAALLGCLRQVRIDGEPKYLYPSAGSSYAVQTYLHVRPGRVAGMAAGTYYYHPVDHRLVPLAAGIDLPADIHDPFVNRPIFDQAAFSLFLVVELEAIVPLYGDHSLQFATLEAGYMGQVLMETAAEQGLGLCPVGLLDFERVRPHFGLGVSHVLVHSLLGGAVDGRAMPWVPTSAYDLAPEALSEREEGEI